MKALMVMVISCNCTSEMYFKGPGTLHHLTLTHPLCCLSTPVLWGRGTGLLTQEKGTVFLVGYVDIGIGIFVRVVNYMQVC